MYNAQQIETKFTFTEFDAMFHAAVAASTKQQQQSHRQGEKTTFHNKQKLWASCGH